MTREEIIHGGGDLHGPAYSIRGEVYGEGPRKTAIFDRDGVLNAIEEVYTDGSIAEERGAQTLEEFEEVVYDRVEQLFQGLRARGYRVAVLTNQPDVGKHDRPLDLETLELKAEKLIDSGADIVEACPHRHENHEEEYVASLTDARFAVGEDFEELEEEGFKHEYACNCHKPGAAMFRLLDDFVGVDWENSFMVGDSASDLEAANSHRQDIGGLYFIQHYEGSEAPEMAEGSFEDIDEFTREVLDGLAYEEASQSAGNLSLLGDTV
jgi:HAD superfamily hydrolase (TIGR01662 family)